MDQKETPVGRVFRVMSSGRVVRVQPVGEGVYVSVKVKDGRFEQHYLGNLELRQARDVTGWVGGGGYRERLNLAVVGSVAGTDGRVGSRLVRALYHAAHPLLTMAELA